MPRPDKGTEPSMEEILASIRKIIAEEPIGSRFEPVHLDALSAVDPVTPVNPVTPVKEQASVAGTRAPMHFGNAGPGIAQATRATRGRVVLDDALADLVEPDESEAVGAVKKSVQGPPLPAAALPAKTPSADTRQRPSWLFSHPHPIPNPEPVALSLREPSQAGALPPTARDVPLAGSRAEPGAGPLVNKLVNPSVEGFTAGTTTAGESDIAALRPDGATDHRVVITGQPNAAGPVSGHGLPSNIGPETLPSDPGVEPAAAPAGRSAQEVSAAPVGAMFGTPSDPTSRPEAEAAPARVAAPCPSGQVVGQPAACAAVAAASVPVSTVSMPVSTAAPAVDNVDTATTIAASTALNALAQGLAASTAVPALEESVAAPVNQPVTPAVRTLEDTVADLLRPMLRQWLDANMPRIVEKALRVELAEGVNPAVKTRSL
jgi:cell pole-organizing protein PopZ